MVSPGFGVPFSVRFQPLKLIGWPAVYATPVGLPVPVPLTSTVPAALKVSVTVPVMLASALAGASADTVTLPVLLVPARASMGLAAASARGEVIAVATWPAAAAYGLRVKLSPALAVPAPTAMVRPSTCTGSGPAKLLILPSDSRVTCRLPAAPKLSW